MAGKKSRKQKGKEVRMSPPAIPEPKKGATSKGCFSPTFSQPAPKQATSTVAHVPVNPNLLKRFYEALVMLAVLGKNRGNPVDEEDFDAEPETSSLGTDKLRRSFLRSLAYLCDYEAGGDRATAIALQKTYPKIIYRMASNKCPNPENDWAKDFVATTLQDLSNLQAEKAEEAQSLLFSKAVKFSLKRISRYAQILEEKIDFVLGDFSKATSTEDVMLLTWLQYLKDQVRLPLELCRVCYEVRGSGEYASLQLRARSGSPLSDHFDNIRHYIGRLNHTMKAVKITIETSLRLPDLFYDFEVVRANSPPAFPPPLRERNPTLFAIAGRLSSDTAVIQECRQGLEQLDHLHRLSEQLCSFCTSKDWRPRVHAELILLDLFWTSDFDFVAGDKYIACSKPACYCCYHYIREHPGRFVPPACHNNSWLNWRPPDIYDPTQANLIKVREDVLNEMTKKIGRDVFAQIAERRGPGKWRPDSLTEITSIRQEEFPFTDAEETSNRSMSGEDENETSDLKYSANETYEEQIVQEEDLETEDDEAGGVQLF